MFVGNVGYVARRYINSVAHNKYLELFQEQMASGVFQPHAIFSVLWLTFHDSRFIRRLTGIWSPRGITCPRGGGGRGQSRPWVLVVKTGEIRLNVGFIFTIFDISLPPK